MRRSPDVELGRAGGCGGRPAWSSGGRADAVVGQCGARTDAARYVTLERVGGCGGRRGRSGPQTQMQRHGRAWEGARAGRRAQTAMGREGN
ncbi:hypothetical protein PR202_ga22713 [Eleusine coracana subsp. coracana]|uniref:Uncharacterized protein n=1 Tax=Eleusine coracana subsp. coracana TaxID=191504 RepID=A0AAV5D4M8_ELECO|nr:hypothetical protein PR202_ga22713 [Eleusine coracana subsp. coracana]